MGLPGKGIIKNIRKYSTDHQVIRFDRSTTEYVNGILQPVDNSEVTVSLHTQPIGNGDLIEDLPEGQRQADVKKGWTLGVINKKDQVIIDGIFHTVNAIQPWPLSGHTEFDTIRTGERDNIQ